MRATTEQERRFFDAVKAGHPLFASLDMFELLRDGGAPMENIKLCKLLSPGTLVAIDPKQLDKYLGFEIPVLEF